MLVLRSRALATSSSPLKGSLEPFVDSALWICGARDGQPRNSQKCSFLLPLGKQMLIRSCIMKESKTKNAYCGLRTSS